MSQTFPARSREPCHDAIKPQSNISMNVTPPYPISRVPSTPRPSRQTCAVPINRFESSRKLFRPYPGNPLDPVDVDVDAFLTSRAFELICIQATQLSAVLPSSPPPMSFVSFDCTPMHHWYQSLLMEFVDTFMRKLRTHDMFPSCYTVDLADSSRLVSDEDADAFNTETVSHINAILGSFNTDFAYRGCGSTEGLVVDVTQPHAVTAAMALEESISLAIWPPKKNWLVGEPLHAEYKRRLRMFEAGVTRLVAERDSFRWMLGLPGKLGRGVNAYKEFYIAHLRDEILKFRRSSGLRKGDDMVLALEMDDVFA